MVDGDTACNQGKLLTAVLLVIGIVAATTLVIIGQVGGIATAVFVAVVAIVSRRNSPPSSWACSP